MPSSPRHVPPLLGCCWWPLLSFRFDGRPWPASAAAPDVIAEAGAGRTCLSLVYLPVRSSQIITARRANGIKEDDILQVRCCCPCCTLT